MDILPKPKERKQEKRIVKIKRNRTMSKTEKFISDCTRNCSNEIIVPTQDGNSYTKGYTHWLTPDQARKAVEIAREEMIEKAKKWFEKQNEWINIDGTRHCDMESFEDFRNYMKDE
jgi:hypothetical protein